MALPEKVSDTNSEKECPFNSLKSTDGGKKIVIYKTLDSPQKQEKTTLPLLSTAVKAEHPQESTESKISCDELNNSDRESKLWPQHVTPLPDDTRCINKRKARCVDNFTIPQKVQRLSIGNKNYELEWIPILKEIDLPKPLLSSSSAEAKSTNFRRSSYFPEMPVFGSHCQAESLSMRQQEVQPSQPHGEFDLHNQRKQQKRVWAGGTGRPRTQDGYSRVELPVTRTSPPPSRPDEANLPSLDILGAVTQEGGINFTESEMVKHELKKMVDRGNRGKQGN